MVSEEFKELWNACVGWGKLFAPNEAGIKAFLKFYGAYIHYKTQAQFITPYGGYELRL